MLFVGKLQKLVKLW